jgi:hypothetical protein
LADLISVDYGSADSVQSSQKRIENLIETFSNKALVTEGNDSIAKPQESEFSSKVVRKSSMKQRGGWWRQFRLLFKRAWMQVHLNKSLSLHCVSQLHPFFMLIISFCIAALTQVDTFTFLCDGF